MPDFFARPTEEIVREAIAQHQPVKVLVGFSGGDDSLALAHWMMTHVPCAELFFINTGIGCAETRRFIHQTAAEQGWPLTEIFAKEHCGQDYDELVRRHGFPGPPNHGLMYRCLKERAVRVLVRAAKRSRFDKVLLVCGIREDESERRSRYKGEQWNIVDGTQVWLNAIYWWSRDERDDYLRDHQIRRNPVSRELGMSGECLCGAFAHPGELEQVRQVDPEIAARIDRLYAEVKDRFPWPWDGRPPRLLASEIPVGALCQGCEKSAIVQQELRFDH